MMLFYQVATRLITNSLAEDQKLKHYSKKNLINSLADKIELQDDNKLLEELLITSLLSSTTL